MSYDPTRHHRRSIRLRHYDYNQPGVYYVTICLHQRGAILGNGASGGIALNPLGQLVAACWRALPDTFEHISLDAYVIMPDHLHGVVRIERRSGPAAAWGGSPRGTIPGSLPAIVQSFKSQATRRLNRYRGTPGQRVWLEDYYEHIVRDDHDLARIRRYIAANPARWCRERAP